MEQTKRYAIRKLIRHADGTVGSVLVDLETGQQVADPAGYNVIQNQDLNGYKPPEQEDLLSDEIKKKVIKPYLNDGDNYSTQTVDIRDQGRMGYTEKPGFMSFTNFLPGILGTGSQIVSKVIDVKNQLATDQERAGLGLEKEGFMGVVKSIMPFGSPDNIIAEIQNNGVVTPVTFGGGLTKDGRTGYTPQEALKRSQAIGQPITEALPLQVQQAKENFRQEFPDAPKSGVSEMFSKAKDFLGSLFGRESTKPASQPKETSSSFKETQSFGDFLGYSPSKSEPTTNKESSSSGSYANSYDSVGTPTNNDNSFGGPR